MTISNGINKTWIAIIALGVASIALQNAHVWGAWVNLATHILDIAILLLFVSRFFIDLIRSPGKWAFLRRDIVEAVLVVVFLGTFFWGKYYHICVQPHRLHDLPVKLIIAISVFNVLKSVSRMKRMNSFLKNLSLHPAQTIMLSFLGVIMAGTVLLMLPFSTAGEATLGFINALFTATSAVCVTGLIVVDTATRFSAVGKTVIMCLIQAGGLGIMLFAFFTAFLAGKKLSLEQKLMASYILDRQDTRNLAKGVKFIVTATFCIELAGALLLFIAFRRPVGGLLRAAFYSVFHSVSAFCNAGFALFSGNFAQFRSFAFLNFVIAGLIIAGGISFAVMLNAGGQLVERFRRRFFDRGQRVSKLKLNTKIVLLGTLILIAAGTLLIYKFEHKAMLPESTGTQYLQAFFQSVTLRTAGFNTMDISKLHLSTYALMMLFMFIGGASGSTAGGVKINTVGVIWGYVRSVFAGREQVVLFKNSVSKDQVNQAFLVVLLALITVFSGALILSMTESFKFVRVLFEVFSAFGTVGLSTGITSSLTGAGKLVITLLMFIGRLGPLTIVAALSQKIGRDLVKYPEAKISIG